MKKLYVSLSHWGLIEVDSDEADYLFSLGYAIEEEI